MRGVFAVRKTKRTTPSQGSSVSFVRFGFGAAVVRRGRLFRSAADRFADGAAGRAVVGRTAGGGICSAAGLPYRTRSVRPMRSTVVDLMPFRRQMFVTVVPYLRAMAPSVSPERMRW